MCVPQYTCQSAHSSWHLNPPVDPTDTPQKTQVLLPYLLTQAKQKLEAVWLFPPHALHFGAVVIS
jgi:hypothetical protein